MSSLIVLSDKTVFDILTSLSRLETATFRNDIAKALLSLAVEGEQQYQPDASVITREDGRKILFRPFTFGTGPGVKIIVDSVSKAHIANSASPSSPASTPPGVRGIVAICDFDGNPRGLINAGEMTAYRTAMSVMIPFMWRRNVAKFVMFGAGNAAHWHLDIALRLRGSEIKHVTIINRTLTNATKLINQLHQSHSNVPSFEALSPQQEHYEGRLEMILRDANVVCCATPSSKPLFQTAWLEVHDANRSCFISSVGSWQADMIEIDAELINQAAQQGVVLVDDRNEAMRSSGDLLQSNLREEQIVELGQVLDVNEPGDLPSPSSGYSDVLSNGLVVYKSIGVGFTDLAASNALLNLAKSKDKGTVLSDF